MAEISCTRPFFFIGLTGGVFVPQEENVLLTELLSKEGDTYGEYMGVLLSETVLIGTDSLRALRFGVEGGA